MLLQALLVCSAAGELVRRAVDAQAADVGQASELACGVAMDPFKPHFDALRQQGVAACSKPDVCLLMRELDMHFQNRASKGGLAGDGAEDAGYTLVSADTCKTARRTRNHRGATLRSVAAAECAEFADSKGVPFRAVADAALLSGCSWDESLDGTVVSFNRAASKAEAGKQYRGSDRFGRDTKVHTVKAVCMEVRTMDEASASYWSTYKLKESMLGRAQFSAACSPGLMAQLFRDGRTSSPCARALAHTPEYAQAQDALDRGDLEEAERVMEKNVLFDTITNRWCPEIWAEAETCAVEGPRGLKYALREESCLRLPAEELDTSGFDATRPPDFFRDAAAGGGPVRVEEEPQSPLQAFASRLGRAARSWVPALPAIPEVRPGRSVVRPRRFSQETSNKADRERLAELEQRVTRLEQHH